MPSFCRRGANITVAVHIEILQKNEWVQEVLKNRKNAVLAVRFAALANPKFKEWCRKLLMQTKKYTQKTQMIISEVQKAIQNPTKKNLSSLDTTLQKAWKVVEKDDAEFEALKLAFDISKVLLGLEFR